MGVIREARHAGGSQQLALLLLLLLLPPRRLLWRCIASLAIGVRCVWDVLERPWKWMTA